ncbi:MAG: TldD/PmbA family protein [Oscillospiraceae bacterium]|jgi:PmbA protein|nr:TldD/PmbA family protein [Oscillospiraceae bacterium]
MNDIHRAEQAEFKAIAEETLELLKSLGATGAHLSVSRSQNDELNLDAGKFSLVRTTISSSISINAFIGNKYGNAGTNTLDKTAIEKAARDAVASAELSEPDDANAIAPGIGEHEYVFVEEEVDLGRVYDRVTEFLADTKKEFPLIDFVQFIASFTSSGSYYANSNGTRVYTAGTGYTGGGTVCARDGERVSSMSGVGFTDRHLDKPIIDYPENRRTLGELERQIETVPYEGKTVGTILMPAGIAQEFIGYIVGNCLGNGALVAGISPWRDKIGEKVTDEKFSFVFDRADKRLKDFSPVTNDGYIAEKQVIIENGILKSFALSQYGALKTGLPRATDTSCYIVEGGETPLDEIIAGIENGILMNRFSGGSPTPDGTFSGVAKNSFRIADGKIAEAVSETMVSGNFLEMFNNIIAISRETIEDGSNVMPWIAVSGVTISGK